jgi:hypothetical protein
VTWEHKIATNSANYDPPSVTWYGKQTASTNTSASTPGTWTTDLSRTTTSKTNTTTQAVGKPTHLTKYCRLTNVPGSSYTSGSQSADSSTLCATVNYVWHIDLQTTVTTSTNSPNNRTPGSTITWKHQAKQVGPTITDKAVSFSLSHPTTQTGSIAWTATTTTGSTTFAQYRAVDTAWQTVRTETKTITQDDVGKYLCSQIKASPGGGGNGGIGFSTADRSSAQSCIYIPYQYELVPDTSVSPGTSDGGNINYDDSTVYEGTIYNYGPTKSRSVDWQAFTFVIPNTTNSSTIPEEKKNVTTTAALSDAHLRTIYGINTITSYQWQGSRSSQGNCSLAYNNKDVFFPTTADNNLVVCKTLNLVSIVNNLNLGDRLCFAMYVSPSNATPELTPAGAGQNLSNRSYSRPSCLTVNKSPQVQLKGADSKSGAAKFGQTDLTKNPDGSSNPDYNTKYNTGSGFQGRSSTNSLRGSWSQYGLLANGSITSFGSTGYTQGSTTTQAKACKLSFANSNTGTATNCPGVDGSNPNQFGKLAIDNRIITLPKLAEKTTAELDQLKDQSKVTLIDSTNNASKLPGSTIANGRLTGSLTNLASGTYYVKQNLTITASTLGKDKHITLIVPNTTSTQYSVTLAGNIEPASVTYANLTEIPSLTIIADNIYVQGYATTNGTTLTSTPVKKVYGTYIAKDRFHTCTAQYSYSGSGAWANPNNLALAGIGGSAPESNGDGLCKNDLTVTGAVISKNQPEFTRTYGAGRTGSDPTGTIAEPSEIFAYTPNLYLTPYALAHTGNNNDWRLADLKQLPGRL